MFLFRISLFLLLACSIQLDAAYTLKNGKLVNVKELATLPVEEHYELGIQALKKSEWTEAINQFRIVTINFPESSWGKEAHYFLAVAYFHEGDKDLANVYISEYLKENTNPTYFEESFRYKLAIADAFKEGERRHLFGAQNLPRVIGDQDLSIQLYDEIANSLPHHELAAQALISKAELYLSRDEFKESIESLQTVIRKFPHTEFAAKGYAGIAKAYLDQARFDAHNPDILALASINLKRFTQEFPRNPSISQAENELGDMKEIFANALYETGQFYERKKQPKASVLYYHNANAQFPDTKVAALCKERLTKLQVYVDEMHLASL